MDFQDLIGALSGIQHEIQSLGVMIIGFGLLFVSGCLLVFISTKK